MSTTAHTPAQIAANLRRLMPGASDEVIKKMTKAIAPVLKRRAESGG